MTQSAHTRGPWKRGPSGLEILDQRNRIVAVLGAEAAAKQPEAEQLANARLIAISPKLLDFCQRVQSFLTVMKRNGQFTHPNDHNLLDRLSAAIIEAKGGAA